MSKEPTILERWKVGDSEMLYSEHPIVAQILTSKFKRVGIYQKHEQVVAWQFICTSEQADEFQKELMSKKLTPPKIEVNENNFLEKFNQAAERRSEG